MPGVGWNPSSGNFLGSAGGDLAPEAALERIFDLRPTCWLRRVPGRETFAWSPDEPGPEVVVKRFRGGGGAREVLRELARGLPRGRGARSPAQREHENLVALAADGLPVPPAVAWAAERGASLGRGRSAVVMERVDHAETLLERLERDPAATLARHARDLAALVARLHGRGWVHRDLYLEHVVVEAPASGSERLVLLDLGRARRERRPRRRWPVKDLAALLLSAPGTVPPRARLRFLARYLDARGIAGRRRRRAWARAVARKRRRLAAHAPRHGPPRLLAPG